MTIGIVATSHSGSGSMATADNSATNYKDNQSACITSPQLFAIRARISGEWKDLVYREALRMTGALRQILSQGNNNNRSQLTRKFLNLFNDLLVELRKPNGLNAADSDLHGLSTDFETLLKPWIEIFNSDGLTGSFIHSGLLSIRSFLMSGMFTDVNSPFSRSFIHDLVFSLAHSRFEPTVLENDEIVMLELVEFLGLLVKMTVAATKSENYSANSIQNSEIVGETFVFQLFDLLFALINQSRFSELLRAKAVEIAVEQCSLLFGSLKTISSWRLEEGNRGTCIQFPNIVKPKKPATPTMSSREIRPLASSPTVTSPTNSDSVVNINSLESEESLDNSSLNDNPNAQETIPSSYNPFTDENENELAPDAVEEVMKFRAKMAGISLESQSQDEQEIVVTDMEVDFLADRLSSHCLKEICMFLIRCIDIIDAPGKKPPGSVKAEPVSMTSTKIIPSIKTQTTAMKCLVAIFTDPNSELSQKKSVKDISDFERDLIEIIGGDLLKQLLAILSLDTTSRHLSTMSQLLLVIFTNYRSFLSAQFEFFISTCLNIISSKYTKAMSRPALIGLKTTCLEMLAYFLQDPSFISQIFVYYECSLDYQNTLELLTKGIAAGMEKSSGNEEIIGLSGEILCNFIKTIEASLSKVHSKTEIEDLKELLERRRIKMIYTEASTLFNSNPKESFPFLQQKQLLSSQPTPKEIASFLRMAQGLDKKVLGEYLVKPNNIEILREFFSAFKFSEETSIDSALRQVLESFRLPGEAQQIDRIMECFSEIYYPSATATFCSQDACYILAFSTLMLNTDLHNPQVKNKMTLPDFIRNNRGINDGKDVDEQYLSQLYLSIKMREIVMPEEHGGEEAFASQWNEVQKKSNVIIEFEGISLCPLVCGIVEIVWKPIILSLIPYINQQRPTGEVISDAPLESLRGIASLFEKFQMTEALDALLGNIWSVSNLIPVFSAASGNMIPRYLARLPGFRQVVQLIVDIFKGQGDGLKSSWTNWCRLLIILTESNLIGVESVITQESVLFSGKNEAVSLMSLMRMAHEGRQVLPAGKQSFISSISRFFVNNNEGKTGTVTTGTPSNASDEITTSARQFVGQLPLLDVLVQTIPRMQSKVSFMACIESICSHLKWNLAAGASTGRKMSASSTIGLNWSEDTLIFLTESLISIGLSIEPGKLVDWNMFTVVSDTLTRLVLQDPSPPVKLCEHVVVGVGRLILRLSEANLLSIELFVGYLKFWCQINPQLQGLTLEPFMSLTALTFSKLSLASEVQIEPVWPPMFTILSTASKFESSSPYTLKLLQIISESKDFPVDFFTEFLELLSGTIIGCNLSNFQLAVFDPWRNGQEVTRGLIAQEALKLYERVFNIFNGRGTFYYWKDFLVPLESNLSRHGPLHPVKIIRQQAINLLARLLPQTNFKEKSVAAPILFSKILIPLLVDLRLRQDDCDEIVTRCASLTCKTFLLHLDDLGMPAGQLWKEILEAMLPLILVSQPSEMLKEGVLESCKNVLLVMHSSNGFEAESDVWRVSEVMLGPLIPGWKIEIEMRLNGGNGGDVDNELHDDDQIVESVDICEPVEAANNVAEPIDLVSEPIDHVDEPRDLVDEPIDHVDEPIDRVSEPIDHVDEPKESAVDLTVEPVVETAVEPANQIVEPVNNDSTFQNRPAEFDLDSFAPISLETDHVEPNSDEHFDNTTNDNNNINNNNFTFNV